MTTAGNESTRTRPLTESLRLQSLDRRDGHPKAEARAGRQVRTRRRRARDAARRTIAAHTGDAHQSGPHLAWRFNPGSVKSILPQTALEGQSSQGQLPHSHALKRRLTTKREAVPAARGASASCRRHRHDTRPSPRRTWRGEEALDEQGSLPRAARGQEKNKKSIANSRQKKSIAKRRQQLGKKKSVANSKQEEDASPTAGKKSGPQR